MSIFILCQYICWSSTYTYNVSSDMVEISEDGCLFHMYLWYHISILFLFKLIHWYHSYIHNMHISFPIVIFNFSGNTSQYILPLFFTEFFTTYDHTWLDTVSPLGILYGSPNISSLVIPYNLSWNSVFNYGKSVFFFSLPLDVWLFCGTPGSMPG